MACHPKKTIPGPQKESFGYYNEEASPAFREGVKYFQDRKTDIFLINLNKSEKDFSPSTMYEDYAINSTLFHWQSQSQDREQSPKIQRYINHRAQSSLISLFVREFKKNGSYTAPYVFLGNADHVSHQGEQPASFTWRLHQPLPADITLIEKNVVYGSRGYLLDLRDSATLCLKTVCDRSQIFAIDRIRFCRGTMMSV